MSKQKSSGWAMPLMEMIVVVFFFILCAGICIQVYVKSDQISRLSEDTGHSIMMAQSIAETVKAHGEEGLQEILNATTDGTGLYRIDWDKAWKPLPPGELPVYWAEISVSEEDEMLQADISVFGRSQMLYQLSVSRYMGIAPTEKTVGGGLSG
ncbi:MAG: hypothetical protein RR466_03485 [Hungatella sp.]